MVTARERKAMAIARDVIKRIKMEKLLVRKGFYLLYNDENNERNYEKKIELTDSTNAQHYLPQFEKNCQVCALGGCMLSAIRKYDDVKINRLIYCNNMPNNSGETARSILLDYFDDQDICLIECAFEQNSYPFVINQWYSSRHDYDDDEYNRIDRLCTKASKRYTVKDPSLRLIKIMENVVKHNGHFVP